ncbi:MAG: ADP-ribosylglycohydrolase family protein [Bacteroidales bacterium]|nr:ADP-ribosylglycohydrolase family protein [Bacteroidales bacterium]
MNNKGIIGAIIGDIVGSRFEFNNYRSTDFEFLNDKCFFTDDSVMTIAVADWVTNKRQTDRHLALYLREWGRKYPNRGYGGMFLRWLLSKELSSPYNSFGNGSAMRVSPCGFYAQSLDEALLLAKQSAEVTHNHPEGIKGAQSVAAAIYLAKTGSTKAIIKEYIENNFGYDLSRTCDEIRRVYKFNETCQETCPEAIIAFLESHDYESAIRLGISLGGDSDTIGAITGGIAAAYYGIPDSIMEDVKRFIPFEFIDIVEKFENSMNTEKRISADIINNLKPNEIFVFGSNLDGMHGGGAARVAYNKFGAIWGQGVGLQGQSYAIPTMHGGVNVIKPYVDEFIDFAKSHTELKFLVTRIGCGIAGFTDEEIAPLFKEAIEIENIYLPKSFYYILVK